MSDATPRFRVFVVEDEPLIAMDIEDTVKHLGHDVVGPVGTFDKAVSLVSTGAFDVAILDVNLRGVPSYPIIDDVIASGRPVLLLSGYAQHALPERFLEAAYLRKPFTDWQLNEEIHKLFAHSMSL